MIVGRFYVVGGRVVRAVGPRTVRDPRSSAAVDDPTVERAATDEEARRALAEWFRRFGTQVVDPE